MFLTNTVQSHWATRVTELYCFIFLARPFLFAHERKLAACLGRRCTVNAPVSLQAPDSALVSSPPPLAYALNVCEIQGKWAQGGGVPGVQEMSAH